MSKLGFSLKYTVLLLGFLAEADFLAFQLCSHISALNFVYAVLLLLIVMMASTTKKGLRL